MADIPATAILGRICALVSDTGIDAWKEAATRRDRAFMVSFVNPYSCKVARDHHGHLRDVSSNDLVLADGMLMCLATGLHRRARVARFSFDGNSLAPGVFAFCQARRLPVALVGGASGVPERAAELLGASYPDLRVAYVRNGFFGDDGERAVAMDAIIACGASVVVVGMGAPYQDRFMKVLRERGFRGAAFSCGGYLDQIGLGRVAYYPALVERLNLRFAYRVYKEPRRLGHRYVVDYAPFYRSLLGLLGRRLFGRRPASPLNQRRP